MIARAFIGRAIGIPPRAGACSVHSQQTTRRGLAAVASGSFSYETGGADGVKFASRDLAGPTTTLAVVAKAGTRYQALPGFADGLEKFAFKVSTYNLLGF